MHERNTSNTIWSCYSPNWIDLTINPLEIDSPWYPPYIIPARFRIWLHLTNTLTFHAANVIHTATEATTKTSLWVNIVSPISHVNWSLSVCYCWSDCFSTSPIQHGTRIKKNRWKKSRRVKGHLAYIRPLHHNAFNWPILPPFQTPFAPTEHVHGPLTRVPI